MLNFYGLESVARIAKKAGYEPKVDAASIAATMDALALAYLQRRSVDARPPAHKLLNSLRIISASAKKLSWKLKDEETSVRFSLTPYATMITRSNVLLNLDDRERSIGHSRLDAAIAVVDDLLRWSEAAEQRIASGKGRGKRHKGDTAMPTLIEGLMELWVLCWRRTPSISNSADKPEPFVRFVRAYLDVLESKLDRRAYARNPGLRQALRPSDTAIRERIRSTDLAALLRSGKSPQKNG